jgi:hypothetical protein
LEDADVPGKTIIEIPAEEQAERTAGVTGESVRLSAGD